MIERLVKLTFRPDAVDEFEQIFTESRATIAAWPGCVELRGWRCLSEQNVYFTFSRWIDEGALNHYRHSEFFGQTWARTKQLFAARPEAWSSERIREAGPPAPGHHRMLLDDYHIDIGDLHADQLTWLTSLGHSAYFVVVDEHTNEHCWPKLVELLKESHQSPDFHLITLPAGEEHKTLDTTQQIWQELFEATAGRRACVLNLGGGVIGDMGGFAAATYKRGIDFIQIPTTLLSQVDASVGGKLGIDFNGLKNSIGVFRNPLAVWIDPTFLRTLPVRELRSGYAEVIKHALIADAAQWEQLTNRIELSDLRGSDSSSVQAWSDIIHHSVAIKQRIVTLDPKETDLRKSLNFGHTIGHAIESYWLGTDRRLLHGEAIAAGMICEAWLSGQLLGLPPRQLEEIVQYVLKIYGHQAIPEDAFPELIATMRQDKKNEGAEINCSLLLDVGVCKVNVRCAEGPLLNCLKWYNGLRK